MYKLFKEEDGYEPLLEISPYSKLIQLKYFLGGISHCVTVVGKWIFDSNIPFELPLTKDNLDYCWINYNETKGKISNKGLLKAIRFTPKDNNKSVFQKWKFITCIW